MKKIKKNSAVKVTKVENGELQAKEANFKLNSLNAVLLALALIVFAGAGYHLNEALNLGDKFNNEKEADDELANGGVIIDDEEVVVLPTATPVPAPAVTPDIGGSFVDNHNQELYIARLEEIKEVDKGNTIGGQTTNNKVSSSTSYVAPSATAAPTYVNNGYINNGVQNNTYIENNGSMDLDVDQDNTVAPVGPGSTVVVPTPTPVPTPAPTPVPTPAPTEVPENNELYVLRKLNEIDGNRIYYYYYKDGQMKVHSDELEQIDQESIDLNSSNILVLSSVKEVSGFVFVRVADEVDFVSYDKVEEAQIECSELKAENMARVNEPDAESLKITP